VAGTVVSVLFGVEARRKADALEQQTRAAQNNAARAEENEKAVGRALVSGLLIPIGRNPHQLNYPLDATEADAMRQLRAASAPLRLQFLETALRDRETARRVGRRADWVVQAIVGCDRALRADVVRLVARRIQEPDAPGEPRLACARLGLALNLADRAWAERSADALLVELRDPQAEPEECPSLAEALAAVSERLPPNADHVVRALDFFLTRLRDRESRVQYYQQLGPAIVAISPALDVAAASRVAEELGAIIRRPDSPQFLLSSLSKALAAVCRRLPAADAADHVNRAADFLISEARDAVAEKNRLKYFWQAEALGVLCGQLDSERAGRAAGVILAILGESQTVGEYKDEFISHPNYVSVLTKLAERLDAPASLRAAEDLVLVLRKAGNLAMGVEEVRAALVAVCGRLDQAGAARVAGAIVAAARDPKAVVVARVLFADALAALADRLTPNQAASLESAIVDGLLADLANAQSRRSTGLVGQALAKASGRPGATSAARVAEALTAAIRDPQTLPDALKPLATALAVVSGRLPPREASSHASRAADRLDSLWADGTARANRAALGEALAAVWTRLDSADAAARARRVAADLEDALRDAKAPPENISGPALTLAVVYDHLDAAERGARANVVVDAVVAALRRPKKLPWTISQLAEALAALCAHVDRPGVERVADALLAALDDPNAQPATWAPILSTHPDLFASYDTKFKKIVARLDERELRGLLDHPLAAGRIQRVILDVLGESKHRHFRNTWDYLDWTESNRNGPAGESPETNR
jgi:hypothetical protein